MKRPANTWPNAARALARRVTRRDRLGAFLRPFGRALLLGGAFGLALRLLADPTSPWPEAAVGAGVLLGLVRGAWAARHVGRVGVGDAAWALDRVAGARERGLVAATVSGPVGAEAAWARDRIDPPRVRLLPPLGLATALGGVLAVALVFVVPAPAEAGNAGPGARAPTAGPGAAAGAESPGMGEPAGEAAATRARVAASVREALGLGPQEASDPDAVAERLRSGDAREAAEEAAPEGSELAALLAEGAGATYVAEALADGARAEIEAREARQRVVEARAREGVLAVPARRRDLVERYFWILGAAEDATDGD